MKIKYYSLAGKIKPFCIFFKSVLEKNMSFFKNLGSDRPHPSVLGLKRKAIFAYQINHLGMLLLLKIGYWAHSSYIADRYNIMYEDLHIYSDVKIYVEFEDEKKVNKWI